MTESNTVTVACWPGGHPPAPSGLSRLLSAYHLRTEAEKGTPVAEVSALPARYRVEVDDPVAAFAGTTVLVAAVDGAPVGCVVLATGADGARAELKRLWVEPTARGRGVGTALVRAALDRARSAGAATVRLSVWRWRTPAIALYTRLGFAVVDSWDDRADLVCLTRRI